MIMKSLAVVSCFVTYNNASCSALPKAIAKNQHVIKNGLGQIGTSLFLGALGMHTWHTYHTQPSFSASFEAGVAALKEGNFEQTGKHFGKSVETLFAAFSAKK